MQFEKLKMPIREKRKMEQLEAQIAEQKATSDYIAIMADVEIPIEEGGEEDAQQDV